MHLSPQIQLPITRHLKDILALIRNNPVTIVSGKTGCGKSTQVPKAIWQDSPSARIAICQPRRVAATSLAVRVAKETRTRLGEKVGYHIGMQKEESANCSIIYMTYGILIQQLLFRGDLPYTHIVLDEIHERSLEMDFCFVALKNILNRRTEENKKTSKLIIMSATLNFESFAKYFATDKRGYFFITKVERDQLELRLSEGVSSISNPKRRRVVFGEDQYSLTKMTYDYQQAVNYQIPDKTPFKITEIFSKGNPYIKNPRDTNPKPSLNDRVVIEAVQIIKGIEQSRTPGDILIFVPGFYQIQAVKKKLLAARIQEKRIVEVHSFFSDELYKKLFESDIRNKLILATNIGESSITLPDCKVVIDFCLTKRSTVNDGGITKLQTRFASKASLIQRMGRVGRVSQGIVYRMIPQSMHSALPEYETPQIRDISLQMVILKAKQLDMNNESEIFQDPYEFLFGVLDPPEYSKIQDAITHLLKEQALVGTGSAIRQAKSLKLTKIGQFMVAMPCELQVSKMILMGIKLRIPGLVVAVASILSATKMFFHHEQRRTNNEQFMHTLIGYDNGLCNDFLLRERLYDHWKQLFYYPKRDRWFADKNLNKRYVEKQIYEQEMKDTQRQFFGFLQQFRKSRASEVQKDFCFPKGVNMNSLRQIVGIEEDLRSRLKIMGVFFQKQQYYVVPLFRLCLVKAFSDNMCQVSFKKRIPQKSVKELNYIQIRNEGWSKNDIDDFMAPETEYAVKFENRTNKVKIEGSPAALKKFIFPKHLKILKGMSTPSDLFDFLTDKQASSNFYSTTSHNGSPVQIVSDSINKILLPLTEKEQYRLIADDLTMFGHAKLLKTSALMGKQTYELIQFLLNKNVEVSLHNSSERLTAFRVGDRVMDFNVMVGEKELGVVRQLRELTIRKHDNKIHCQEEVMPEEDVQVLVDFLSSKNQISKNNSKSQIWEVKFCQVMGYNPPQIMPNMPPIPITKNNKFADPQPSRYRDSKFYSIDHEFKFKTSGLYMEQYLEWKRQEYQKCINGFMQLNLQESFLICSSCNFIQPFERLFNYNQETAQLDINLTSGEQKVRIQGDKLRCRFGHHLGRVIRRGIVKILQEKVKIYVPFAQIEPFWQQWPSFLDLRSRVSIGKAKVEQQRRSLSDFSCLCCQWTTKNPTSQLAFFNSKMNQPKSSGVELWLRTLTHFQSQGHHRAQQQFITNLKQTQ